MLLFAAFAQVLPGPAFGEIAVAQGVLVVAQAIGDFGLSHAATTALAARLAREPERVRVLLGAAALACWFAAAAALLLTALASVLLPAGARIATLLIAPAAACAVVVAGADGLLRAQGAFRRPFGLMAASRLAPFGAVPVATATHSSAATAAAVSVLSLVGTAAATRALFALRHPEARTELGWFARATAPLGLSQVLIAAGARLNTLIVAGASSVREAAAFEATWRLFQLGQYAGGVIATAGAPFLARESASSAVWTPMLRRLVLIAAAVGCGTAVALHVLRDPLGELLYPIQTDRVANLLAPLAAVTPLAIVGQVLLVVLSVRAGDRRFVPWAFLTGAALNLAIVASAAGAGASRAVAGATAAAVSVNLLLALRLIRRPRAEPPRPPAPGRASSEP